METANVLDCDLAAEVVGAFGRACLRISGTSMVPAIHPGDRISVERAGVSEIFPGDIVVFAREDRLIAHRVVAKTAGPDEGHLVTRGDRVRRNDALVSSVELIGRVTHIERGRSRVRVRARLNVAQQLICLVLRFSDRATYLYLRLAAL